MATRVAPSSGRSRPYHDGSTRRCCLACAQGIAQEAMLIRLTPKGARSGLAVMLAIPNSVVALYVGSIVDVFQKRHESLNQRRCSANELAETPRRHGDPPMA